MLKERITYENYDGQTIDEDFWFNLNESELVEMNMSKTGGFDKLVKSIINSRDSDTIIKLIKEIILKSYGVPSLDGKRFVKSKEQSEEFMQTEAYNVLFMRMISDAEYAANFVNGIIPKKAKMSKEQLIEASAKIVE